MKGTGLWDGVTVAFLAAWDTSQEQQEMVKPDSLQPNTAYTQLGSSQVPTCVVQTRFDFFFIALRSTLMDDL